MAAGKVRDRRDAALELGEWLLAGHQQTCVADPVLVPRRLINEALFVHHLHQALGERADGAAEEERHRNVPIASGVDELQGDPAEVHAARDARRWRVPPARTQAGRLGSHHRRGLDRDIDVLANAIADGAEKRHQRPDSSFRSAVQPRLRDGEAKRCAVVVAGHEHRSGGGVEGEVAGGPVGLRAGLPERRYGNDHERRIDGAQRVIAQPQAVEVAGVKGLEEDVGRAGEG